MELAIFLYCLFTYFLRTKYNKVLKSFTILVYCLIQNIYGGLKKHSQNKQAYNKDKMF